MSQQDKKNNDQATDRQYFQVYYQVCVTKDITLDRLTVLQIRIFMLAGYFVTVCSEDYSEQEDSGILQSCSAQSVKVNQAYFVIILYIAKACIKPSSEKGNLGG